MKLNEYQTKLVELWEAPPDCDHLLFCAVGMAEEAGEALGKVKRLMRGDGFDREGYLLELGDCLAYLTIAAHEKGWTLEDIFNARITPEGSDLVRCGHNLLRKTERVLDEILDSKDQKWLLSAMMHTFMQLLWNSSHDTVKSSINEVMQLNITKLEDRIAPFRNSQRFRRQPLIQLPLPQARRTLEQLHPGMSWTIILLAAKELGIQWGVTKEISEEDFEQLKDFLADEQTRIRLTRLSQR